VVEDKGTQLNVGNLVNKAKLYEAQAISAGNDSERITLYKKAAAVHHELGSYMEEAHCLAQASKLLHGEERTECLISCWGVYITAIAVYQYEAGFEWKGEVKNLDPSYDEKLRHYYEGAIDALDKALKIEGVDRDKLLEKLDAECVRRRNEGGWGASECLSSIDLVFKRKRYSS
jgi:hypothetical protein